VEAVGSDHEVEATGRGAFEGNMRAIAVLLNAGNVVAKDGFVAAFDLALDQPGQVTAWKARVTAVRERAEDVDTEAS
jgi:hypothetical protein